MIYSLHLQDHFLFVSFKHVPKLKEISLDKNGCKKMSVFVG